MLAGASTLNVTVFDSAGEPVEGARVLLAGRTGVLLSADADARGKAHIKALSARPYSVQVVRPGFRTENRHVEMWGDQELVVVLASR